MKQSHLTSLRIISLGTLILVSVNILLVGCIDDKKKAGNEIQMVSNTKAAEEVWKTVRAMNQAWAVEGNIEQLTSYFHDDMVLISPAGRERLAGRDSVKASYRAFVEDAEVLHLNELDPKVQLYGDGMFAVVTYYYDMSFKTGGEIVEAQGRDMLVLVKEDGKWWIVAQQFSSYPQ